MSRQYKLGIFTNLILVIFLSSSISLSLYTSFFMTKNINLMIFAVATPLSFLLYFMFKNKLSSLISLIVLGVGLIGTLSYIIFYSGIARAEYFYINYSNWFIDTTNGFFDNRNPFYENITISVMTIFITILVYLLVIKFYNFYVICILQFSVFFLQLQFNVTGSNSSFILFILSFLLFYFFDVLRRRGFQKTYDIGNALKYFAFIIPVCVLVLCISFMLPTYENRVAIKWLDNAFDSTIDKIVDTFSGVDVSGFDYFSIGSTGFGGSDRLGGNIKPNKTHVMNVKSDYSNVYIKAAGKDFYDGHGWYNTDVNRTSLGNKVTKISDGINDDTSRFILLSNAFTNKLLLDSFYKEGQLNIEFVNLKTKSLFSPVKTNYINFPKSQDVFIDKEGNISTRDILNKGFKYSVGYYNLSLGSDDFKKMLRTSYKGYYEDIAKSMKILYTEKLNNSFTDTAQEPLSIDSTDAFVESINDQNAKLINQAEEIYKKYTQLPQTVTERTRQLADKLTKDKKTTYDKAKAVETYLSNNYPYTLTPGTPPRRQDFVDYFLFNGKKGYCSYYASAMVILLRCEGIPARFVEGFMMPPEITDGVFKVTNQQSHAWVEVYFEGFGWIPFEPTSPFVANMYNDKSISATATSDMSKPEFVDYMEMINKYRNKDTSINIEVPDYEDSDNNKLNKPLLALIIIGSVFGLLIILIGLLALINGLKFYLLMRKIKKGSPNDAVLEAYSYILKALKFINMTVKPGETPTQFGDRVEKFLDFKGYSFSKISFITVSEYYVKARYSNTLLIDKEKKAMLDFIDILLQLVQEKSGPVKFVFNRYFMGKV